MNGALIYCGVGLLWSIFSVRLQSELYYPSTKIKLIVCAISNFILWPIAMVIASFAIKTSLWQYKTGVWNELGYDSESYEKSQVNKGFIDTDKIGKTRSDIDADDLKFDSIEED